MRFMRLYVSVLGRKANKTFACLERTSRRVSAINKGGSNVSRINDDQGNKFSYRAVGAILPLSLSLLLIILWGEGQLTLFFVATRLLKVVPNKSNFSNKTNFF